MSENPNRQRGEVTITLAGKSYVMRPSFEAIERIDQACGSILQLAQKGSRMSLADVALVVCEGVKAHGRHVNDPMAQNYSLRRISQMVMQQGLATEAVMLPVAEFLAAALTGGAVDEGNAEAAATGN